MTDADPTPRLSIRRRLLSMLWRSEISPDEILAELNLPPSRMAALLHGKLIRKEIESLTFLAEKQQRLASHRASLSAVNALTALTAGTGETARKACLDLLTIAEQRRQDQPAPVRAEDSALEQRIERILGAIENETDIPAE